MRALRSRAIAMSPSMAIAALLLALAPAAPAAGQDADEWTVTPEEIEAARSARLFRSDDVLEFTLYADFNSIRRRDRGDDADARPALLFVDSDGDDATIELKLQTRGNWRPHK
jgi:hypothetical protein